MAHGSGHLETPRFLLRPLERFDGPAVLRVWSERGFKAGEGPTTLKGADQWIAEVAHASAKSGGYGHRAVVCKGTGEVIGLIGFGPDDRGVGDVDFSFIVARPHRGRGVASEALRAIVDYCFSVLGVESVWGGCDPDNVASARAMDAPGLRYIGQVDGQVRFMRRSG